MSTSGDPAENRSENTDIHPPPTHWGGILRSMGPGMIIAGSIVGSGELIATTKTGAEAGFALLWLILLGCVIKVFAQVEFGRYSINTGNTTLAGMNEVPGPRLHVNWLVWYFVILLIFTQGQQGGLVGGVGQALSLSAPLTGDFQQLVQDQQEWQAEAGPIRDRLLEARLEELQAATPQVRKEILDAVEVRTARLVGRPWPARDSRTTRDDFYWSAIMTLLTIVLLVVGRYRLVQSISMFCVGAFTLLTVANLWALQSYPAWAVHWSDIKHGLSGSLPQPDVTTMRAPIGTALATFGIIGVGASELIYYPYWCLEKGYARSTGPCDTSDGWGVRARGWMRVMRIDAFCSMVLYTFSTLAFYLLGAAVLFRQGLNPSSDLLVPTLAEMYRPVFGRSAELVFLFGAVAVLYSTFFTASASQARILADTLRIFRLGARTEEARVRWVRVFCVLVPMASLTVYGFLPAPDTLVLWSGVAQAIMLPMLGAAALFFRYRRCDARTAPGRLWDGMLWLSFGALLITGTFMALVKLFPHIALR